MIKLIICVLIGIAIGFGLHFLFTKDIKIRIPKFIAKHLWNREFPYFEMICQLSPGDTFKDARFYLIRKREGK